MLGDGDEEHVEEEALVLGRLATGEQQMESYTRVPRLPAVVIGAGGAARAIVAELSLAGAARITVVDRTLTKAEEVAAAVGAPCEAAQLTEP